MNSCSVENCSKPVKSKADGSKGGPVWSGPLCSAHLEKLRRNGDPTVTKKKGPPKGSGNPNTKYYTTDGYVRLYRPTDPTSWKTGFKLEHTIVMEEFLGRPLYEEESVHHKNGVRDDNRIENLELWTNPPRKNIRVEDAIRDCIEFLKRYGIRSCE
jgi:hypothetical protein